MDFGVGGASLITQPANPNQDIIAVGRPGSGDALSLSGQQAHLRTGTRLMGTTTGTAGHGENLVESLDDFIPSQIVAHHQNLPAVGASQPFGLIDQALLGV